MPAKRLSKKEAKNLLQVSYATLEHLIETNQIKVIRHDGMKREILWIPEKSVLEYIKRKEKESGVEL